MLQKQENIAIYGSLLFYFILFQEQNGSSPVFFNSSCYSFNCLTKAATLVRIQTLVYECLCNVTLLYNTDFVHPLAEIATIGH